MSNNKKAVYALVSAATIATITALAHLSCIVLGPACYKAQMAPEAIIQSAQAKTLLAPFGTVLASSLFLLLAWFALAASGRVKKLPLQRLALYSAGILCLLRGIATVPLSLLFPEMVSLFSLVSGGVWLLAGILLLYGVHNIKKGI